MRSRLIKAQAAWVNGKFMSPYYAVLDEHGTIQSVGTTPPGFFEGPVESVDATLLPGMINGHSHAFQFAMAGAAESMDPNRPEESFWTWREAMYQLALTLTPEAMLAVATAAYLTLLRQGYTHVCEFHYLHHDENGKTYAPRILMAEAMMEAAHQVGIGLTLVPVFYHNSTFDQPGSVNQRRFLFHSIEDYTHLLRDLAPLCKGRDVILGHGAHSLRAVPREWVKDVLQETLTQGPIHIHISEQVKEVEDCLRIWGARPVDFLYDTVAVNERFALVHATHLTDRELYRIAKSGATVVICPTTEGNLGDGLFRTKDYFAEQGSWGIGSDSHIGVNPVEELRWLDYQVRLQTLKRNALAGRTEPHSAQLLYFGALRGGQKAAGTLGAATVGAVGAASVGAVGAASVGAVGAATVGAVGAVSAASVGAVSAATVGAVGAASVGAVGAVRATRKKGDLDVGYVFDALALDNDHVSLAGKSPEMALSNYVFSGDRTYLKAVYAKGQAVVQQGRHAMEETLLRPYLGFMQRKER